jgi:hypothetical protein
MSVKINSCLLSLALAAAALPLHAQEAPQQAVAQPEALTVVRDAETGKLRAPTAEEAAAMTQQATSRTRFARVAVQTPLQKFHGSGAVGARLTDEMVSSSAVVVRNADGSLQKLCFDAHDAAETTVKTGHVHVNTAANPTE